MSSEPSEKHATTLATLSLLETRIRRIEFLLTGSSEVDGKPVTIPLTNRNTSSNETVVDKVQQLQNDLNKLRKLSGPAGDLIRDVEDLHTKTPEIFSDISPIPATSLPDQINHIFANAPLYTETASRLSSLQTLQVPSAEQSAQIVDLQPRIQAARSKQEQLEAQARELRERSVHCLEWWVKFGVVGMDELWTDWEERVREAEKNVGRLERLKSEREGYI